MTDSPDSEPRNTHIVVTGTLLLLCVAGITIISRWFPYGPDYNRGPVEWFLVVYAAAWIVYLVAVWRLGRLQGRAVSLIFVFAIAMRLLLLFSNPILEDDFYRYIWDGHVVLAGLSPFATAPEYIDIESIEPDPDKRAAATFVYENINFPWVKTIYPPAAQADDIGIGVLERGPVVEHEKEAGERQDEKQEKTQPAHAPGVPQPHTRFPKAYRVEVKEHVR